MYGREDSEYAAIEGVRRHIGASISQNLQSTTTLPDSTMWLALAIIMQTAGPSPSAYAILEAEHLRGSTPQSLAVLQAGAASKDTVVQRLAARAFGRLERGEYAPVILPLLSSPSVSVRRETLNALAQMNAPFNYGALLTSERDGAVRAAMYEAMGRMSAFTPGAPRQGSAASSPATQIVATLVGGLRDATPAARTGAARGLESLIRRTARASRPTDETLVAIRQAFQANGNAELRQLLLLALTAANDRDSATVDVALRDTSAQVRRLAVALGRRWVNDPSPLVRYQALRVAGTCERAVAWLKDASAHVVLGAVDVLGEKQCAATLVDSLVQHGANWRVQAHALSALAKIDKARAQASMSRVAQSPVWQARAWAAQAAKAIGDTATLSVLAKDSAPNVAAAAITTDADAMRALAGTHSGLVLAAATHFKGAANAPAHASHMADALMRLSAKQVATNRDPRAALLQRLLESADSATAVRLTPLVRDLDPDVSRLAARVITERAHIRTEPATTTYVPAPFPSDATLRSLRGATAQIRIKSIGTMDIALLPDDAPATVATFVELAERGMFNNLTWHRIVPNFVLQGGSPGADEYDGVTPTFMRDELGFARHARGTFGISTRGRDTGDGQLFINLVDNFRLDHDYSVFATMRSGLTVMDRVQEGDVIESVRIIRKGSK